jgi:hypothetical protein
MALVNQPVFAQKSYSAVTQLATANTALDGTGTIATLFTAGPDGALLTHLHIVSRATSVATAVRLFLSYDGGVTWGYVQAVLSAAFTVANTTAQVPPTLIDRNNPDGAWRIPAGAVVGLTEAVATPLNVYAEWIDF